MRSKELLFSCVLVVSVYYCCGNGNETQSESHSKSLLPELEDEPPKGDERGGNQRIQARKGVDLPKDEKTEVVNNHEKSAADLSAKTAKTAETADKKIEPEQHPKGREGVPGNSPSPVSIIHTAKPSNVTNPPITVSVPTEGGTLEVTNSSKSAIKSSSSIAPANATVSSPVVVKNATSAVINATITTTTSAPATVTTLKPSSAANTTTTASRENKKPTKTLSSEYLMENSGPEKEGNGKSPSDEPEPPRAAPSQELEINTGAHTRVDYIIPIVSLIFAVPILIGAAVVFYRRIRDYWSTRHYRRMNFLIDGMYNE